MIVFYGEKPITGILPEYKGYCLLDITLLDILYESERVITKEQYNENALKILFEYEGNEEIKLLFFKKDSGNIAFDEKGNEYTIPINLDLKRYYKENKYVYKYCEETVYTYSCYGEIISEDDYYESGMADECSVLPSGTKRYIYKEIKDK